MKFIFSLIFLAALAFGGYVLFQKYQAGQSIIPQKTLNVSLVGIVRKVSGNSEFSFQLVGVDKVTGLNSSHLDLAPFVGERIQATGQYSGTVLFVDSVKVNP